MDFQSAMETFAEAWVAANAGTQVCEIINKQGGWNLYGQTNNRLLLMMRLANGKFEQY